MAIGSRKMIRVVVISAFSDAVWYSNRIGWEYDGRIVDGKFITSSWFVIRLEDIKII